MRMLIFAAALFLAWPGDSAAAASRNMRFDLITVGDCKNECMKLLLGEGVITNSTYRSFRSAQRRAAPGTPVLLHSPGGTLMGGMLLGAAFRERGTTVGVVPGGACYSACVYALLGGKNRKVLNGGKVGVHRFYLPEHKNGGGPVSAKHKAADLEAQKLLNAYVRQMGASPELVKIALSVKPADMRMLSRKELARLKVVTR